MEKEQTISDHPVHLRELLAWYADAGLDFAIEDGPIDRFAETAAAVKAKAAVKAPVTTQAVEAKPRLQPAPQTRQAVPNQQAVTDAKVVAEKAEDLAALKHAVEGFEGCNLRFAAKTTVFGQGVENPRVMIITDPPGRDEEEENAPIAGAALTMLHGMLGVPGLTVDTVYTAPIIPWRPAGNRPPSALEMQICLPFLHRQIELVQPKFLLVMGGTAAHGLLPTKGNILSTRGKWQDFQRDDHTIPALVTLSPRYLLTTPTHKRFAFQDLLQMKERLKSVPLPN